jgi:hypothetical protein
MVASPSARQVTSPAADTVAIAVFDDCHVAWLVTSWFVPFVNPSVAVNCDVWLTSVNAVVPPTVTDIDPVVVVVVSVDVVVDVGAVAL